MSWFLGGIAFLILGSLAVAVTLVPLLCYFLLDESKVHLDALQRVQKGGRRVVRPTGKGIYIVGGRKIAF